MTDHNNPLHVELAEPLATKALGAALSRDLSPGLRIYLHGDLGAGKTTLVQGLLAALGHRGRVKSPTYTLVEVYELSRLNLYHFDFYRFRDGNEWRDAGFSEVFDSDAICIVEWPEKAGEDLPQADVDVVLEVQARGRRAVVRTNSAAGAQCYASLASFISPGNSS